SCAAPSAKGDDKFITTDYLQQCPVKCLCVPRHLYGNAYRESSIMPLAMKPTASWAGQGSSG
ncbi:hypothetical protein, partial [Escherichia coli]|uniref:hypothetical protein n=1 Tax=Escherichia coli TaxID=562 RepID=UPI0032D58F16